MRTFLAHFLFVLAAWTLVVKFAFPIGYAIAEGTPALGYVMWDFWWAAHLWLGWALLRRPPHAYALAMVVSLVEIVIVVTKFALFLPDPTWTIWTASWFVNKVFVLACFVALFAVLLAGRHELSRRDAAATAD